MPNHIEAKDFTTTELLEIFGLADYPKVDERGRCVNCKARVRIYKHELSTGLLKILAKFAQTVGHKKRNEIHLLHDMDGDQTLSRVEYNNFQKLRYHGLVAKVRKHPAHWLLTHLGSEFLHGRKTVPRLKVSYRNVIVGRTEDQVGVRDIKNEPWWPRLDFEIPMDEQYKETKQTAMF